MIKYLLLILITLLTAAFIIYVYKLRFVARKAWLYTAIISFVAMIIFNTYLTALPIVVYNMNSILGFKIFSFPIEDVGYLIVTLILLPPLFERLSDEERIKKRKPTKR